MKETAAPVGAAKREGAILAQLEQCAMLSQQQGLNNVAIAARLGITPEYVGQLLSLATASPEVLAFVRDGRTTAAVAILAIRQHGKKAATVLEESFARAVADGKGRLTRKYLPDQVHKRALQRAAPGMYRALQQLSLDVVYSRLPERLRTAIDAILATVGPTDPKRRTGGAST